MSQTDLTVEGASESLTGFDEIAITHHFGHTIADLAQTNASMFVRALVFIIKRREGATDEDARNAAMGMTLKDSTGFFAESSEEEAGKDEPLETSPAASLTSVS